jgi:CRP/FNR family cyclic AMP-dependent transcriptional regulator
MFQWPSGLEWLRDIPILSRQRFVEEQVILSGSDELPRTIHVVLEGVVRLSLLAADGRERAMLYLGRGMIFGEQAALAQTPLRAGLVAIADKPCLIGHILPKSILAAVKRNPELILDVMRITSEKTSSFLEDLSRSAFGSAQAQIATLLSTLAEGHEHVSVSQDRLAHITGLTRITVSTQLHQLESRGAIRLERMKIRIVNSELLLNISTGAT